MRRLCFAFGLFPFLLSPLALAAVPAGTITVDPTTQYQTITGFGAFLSSNGGPYTTGNFPTVYAQDLGASMMRMSIDPSILSGAPGAIDTTATVDTVQQYEAAITASNTFTTSGSASESFGPLAAAINAQKLDQFTLYASVFSPPAFMKANDNVQASTPPLPDNDGDDGVNGNTENESRFNQNYGTTQGPFAQGNVPAGATITFNPYADYYSDSFVDPNNHLITTGPTLSYYDPAAGATVSYQALNANNLQNFANYVTAYLLLFNQNYHVNVSALSIQNELQFTEPYVSATYVPAQYAQAINTFGQTFAANGVTTKLIGPENVGADTAGYFTSESAQFVQALQSTGAIQYLGAYATHNPSADPTALTNYANALIGAGGNLSSWMTEHEGDTALWPNATATSVADSGYNPNDALGLAVLMNNSLQYGNFSTFDYYGAPVGANAISGGTVQNPGTGSLFSLDASGNTLTNNYKYAVFKHFSRYIRPGSIRIAADAGTTISGLSFSAYEDVNNHTLTLELINTNGTDTLLAINLSKLGADPSLAGLTDFQQYLTDPSNVFTQGSDVLAVNNLLTIDVPAYGFVTLNGTAPTAVPEPSTLALLAVPALALATRRHRGRA